MSLPLITQTLADTVGIMRNILARIADRGEALVASEERAAQMEDLSHDFYFATLPAWRQTLLRYTPPGWWCCGWWGRLCCRACRRRERLT
jgi:hypothetical protein